jgi:hypothetical protein
VQGFPFLIQGVGKRTGDQGRVCGNHEAHLRGLDEGEELYPYIAPGKRLRYFGHNSPSNSITSIKLLADRCHCEEWFGRRNSLQHEADDFLYDEDIRFEKKRRGANTF